MIIIYFAYQNNTFIDSSGNNFTVTRIGTTTQGSVNPFGSIAPYDTTVEGGSGYFNGTTNLGNSSNGWWTGTQKLLDIYFNYTKKFGKFNTDITAGHTYQETRRDSYNSGNINNPNNVINSLNYYLDPVIKLESYFGRANFGYDSKYLLTLNARRDTSNRFDPSNNTENFYGAALAWVVSNEDFLKDSKSLTS